ncbi:hypothetical protein F6V25_14580 [Oryzomonas japonica]|uniref:Uncharacterized protein n=1 Tax=Oryzomonas japonica TaxID=2603858 RepID=A0A7J4ZNF8_9BACT|nr:hypothetical protein [Oryzomonas japonica]KAB0664030.1 hypothetical protein F6V25_14580 [Oryzomonas japonica]
MEILAKMDIDEVFGNEAGEEESRDFLKEVYIENDIYARAIGNTRIVCVRSRKGVGKSALLARAFTHCEHKGYSALWLSPTDLAVQLDTDYNISVDRLKKRLARLSVGCLAKKIGFSAAENADEAIAWAEKDGFRSKDFISKVAKTFQDVVKAKNDPGISEDSVTRLLARFAEQKVLTIFIDDLDRGWRPTGPDSIRLKAMISAIREIARECDGVSFRLSLREDVWQYLEIHDEQIDKFRQYAHFLKWDDAALRKIIGKRIWHYCKQNINGYSVSSSDDLSNIYELFDRTYTWSEEIKQMHEVLTNLSRRRPRDIIQLVKGAAVRAKSEGHTKIQETDVRNEFVYSYSRVRTLDLIKEFKNECEQMESLITVFGGKRYIRVMPYQEVIGLIKSVNGRISIEIFGKRATDVDCHNFLYRCGFISAREKISLTKYRHKLYEDAPSLIESMVGVEKYDWEIHAAFRPYLESLQVSPYQEKTRKSKRGR